MINKPQKIPITIQKTSAPANLIISWRAPEYIKYPTNINRLIIFAIVDFLIIFFAIITRNILMAVLFFLIGIVVYIYNQKEPKEINFAITPKGITIDQTLYPYQDLISFWINYNPPIFKELLIRHKKKLLPLIKIPLANQNPTIIRNRLLEFLPEKEEEESLIELISQILKF